MKHVWFCKSGFPLPDGPCACGATEDDDTCFWCQDSEEDQMGSYYVTFGSGQHGGRLANSFLVVKAPTYSDARVLLRDLIGDKFAFVYDEGVWSSTQQEQRFGLRRVPLEDVLAIVKEKKRYGEA